MMGVKSSLQAPQVGALSYQSEGLILTEYQSKKTFKNKAFLAKRPPPKGQIQVRFLLGPPFQINHLDEKTFIPRAILLLFCFFTIGSVPLNTPNRSKASLL